jgi:chromosome segregation ATPase
MPPDSRATISKLMTEIRSRDEKLLILEQEVRHLLRYEDANADGLTQRFREEPAPNSNFHLWTEERKVMETEIRTLKDQLQKQAKLTAAETKKTRTLKDRVEVLSAVLKHDKKPIPSGPVKPIPEAKSLDWDNAIEDEEPSLSDSHTSSHRQPEKEEEPLDLVPGEAFDAVQKKLSKFMTQCSQQEEELAAKNKTLEEVETKYKRLERIHETDKNMWKKKEGELLAQVYELQRRMDILEKEAKRKTNQMRSEILMKLKKEAAAALENNV